MEGAEEVHAGTPHPGMRGEEKETTELITRDNSIITIHIYICVCVCVKNNTSYNTGFLVFCAIHMNIDWLLLLYVQQYRRSYQDRYRFVAV